MTALRKICSNNCVISVFSISMYSLFVVAERLAIHRISHSLVQAQQANERKRSRTSSFIRSYVRSLARREFSYQIRYSIIMQTHKHTSNDVIVTLVHPIVIAKSCYKTALDSLSFIFLSIFSLFSAACLSFFLFRHSLSFTHVFYPKTLLYVHYTVVGSFVCLFVIVCSACVLLVLVRVSSLTIVFLPIRLRMLCHQKRCIHCCHCCLRPPPPSPLSLLLLRRAFVVIVKFSCNFV